MARLLAYLTLWAALVFSAVATAQTIPNLPAASQGNATDLYACSQGPGTNSGNTTRKCTPIQILNGAGGAPLASPAFTGTPTAPTPSLGDNSTKIATTAFINLFQQPGLINAVTAGLDNTGTTDDSTALQTLVSGANGNCIFFPAGTYLFHGITSSNPICIVGVGNGAGPGPAAQSNTNVTQFMLNSSTSDLFTVTSVYPSYFRNFQVNVPPANRPMSSGSAIHLIGTGSNVVANYLIDGVGFTNVYQPIHVLRPAWGVIENSYFDTWYNSAVYLETSSGIEGSGGDIEHNFFFGFTTTTTPPIYSGVGYTNIHNNEILGGNFGVEFNIANNAAGFIKVHDNTIENFSSYCVGVQSADGHTASMVMIQHNECSTYTVGVTASYVIGEYPSNPAWVTDVLIQGNVSRNTTANGGKHYWVQAGQNVVLEGNVADELGSAGGVTAYQVTGNTTSAGLSPPFIVSNNSYIGSIATPYNVASNAGAVTSTLDASNNWHQGVPSGSVFDWDVAGTTKMSLGSSGLTAAAYRSQGITYANISTVIASPAVGDQLVITDASACTANTAVTSGGGTTHSCAVVYNGAAWVALVTH